jgi:hypothetical protein
MRLINTQTLRLEEFTDYQTPQYAILSHTWEAKETRFEDLSPTETLETKGDEKILNCCRRAAKDGWSYVWVDTCCIDKRSSAELSEAINSMFRWYQYSVVCYAYLCDVSPVSSLLRGIVGGPGRDDIAKSKWFTRGWTLQELIAPQRVIFFSRDWREIGTKDEWSDWLSEITGIDKGVLMGKSPECVPVAHRMSWASMRETTRVEDIAYSLMGLFGVNMPMIYGEGERAFIRLQEEIMRTTYDRSLFAWKSTWESYRGLLARHPREFSDCRKLAKLDYPAIYSKPSETSPTSISIDYRRDDYSNPFSYKYGAAPNSAAGVIDAPYFQTNMGICIRLPLIFEPGVYYYAVLDWKYEDEKDLVRIPLDLLEDSKNTFVRRFVHVNFDCLIWKTEITTIYVKQFFGEHILPQPKRLQSFRVTLGEDLLLVEAHPPERWDSSAKKLEIQAEKSCMAGVLLIEHSAYVDSKIIKARCVVFLGLDEESRCWAYICRKTRQRLKRLFEAERLPNHYGKSSCVISRGKTFHLTLQNGGTWHKKQQDVHVSLHQI